MPLPIKEVTLVASSTLTATVSFTAATTVRTADYDQLNALVTYVVGTGGGTNVAIMTVQFSRDGVTWYQDAVSSENASTGVVSYAQATHRFIGATAATTYRFPVNIPVQGYQHIRIGVHETLNAGSHGTIAIIGDMAPQV